MKHPIRTTVTVAIIATLIACTPTPQGVRNAIQYAREKIAETAPAQVENVKDITWDRTDTVIAFFEFDMLAMEAGHIAVTPPFVMARIDSTFDVIDSVFDAMQLYVVGADGKEFLPKAISGHQWRDMHRLTIHMKSGATKTTDIIMDQDGLTPVMTGKEYQDRIKKAYEQALDLRYSMSDYYLFNGIR